MRRQFASRKDLDHDNLEEGHIFAPEFDASGLIPAIIQDAETEKVLMFAYMNREALDLTLTTGEAHYWSRSRQSLWHKGATSGHIQKLVEIRTDCDQDVVLLRVLQTRAACHKGYKSCFYRVIKDESDKTVLLKTDMQRLINPAETAEIKGKSGS